ncbi:MAG TPA: flagellar motor switch protein FliN [Bryobacteraceae bacterium]|nr:flagellar motor switch protein FliN [Bryobacteraceae bacterium]
MNEQQTDAQVSNTPQSDAVQPSAATAISEPAASFLAAPLLMDIKLPIRVRMGGTQMSLRAISQLTSGSVIELDCSADDPVQIVVNDRVIAEGEVVVVGGNYGVRVTRIAGPNELKPGTPGERELRNLSEQLK